jgi:hypothetical protein
MLGTSNAAVNKANKTTFSLRDNINRHTPYLFVLKESPALGVTAVIAVRMALTIMSHMYVPYKRVRAQLIVILLCVSLNMSLPGLLCPLPCKSPILESQESAWLHFLTSMHHQSPSPAKIIFSLWFRPCL